MYKLNGLYNFRSVIQSIDGYYIFLSMKTDYIGIFVTHVKNENDYFQDNMYKFNSIVAAFKYYNFSNSDINYISIFEFNIIWIEK